MRRFWGWMVGILLVALASIAPAVRAGPTDWDNETDGYLNNGGFEGTFYNVGDEWIATNWTRLYLDGSADWNSTCRFVNGWDFCDAGWVEKIGGRNSHILSVEDLVIGQPFDTVLYQTTGGLTVGKSYSFSGWTLKMWGGSANHNPPADPYSLGSRVGVDPTGGTNPTAPTVQWDEWNWEFRADRNIWLNQRLAFTAQSTQATVFVQVWHKWERAETQVIVDSMELFDAPTVVATVNSGSQPPSFSWVGTLPPMFAGRGPNFHLFYDVQKQQPNGSWATIAHWTQATSYTPTLAPGEVASFRVIPFAYEPPGSPINWPPTIHVGLPSSPLTLTQDITPPTASIRLPNGPWQPAGTPLPVGWLGYDDASGVATYDVEYRTVGATAWTRWLTATTATSATLPESIVGGAMWEFRVRARDNSGNEGQWSNPKKVSVYGAMLSGNVRSAANTPLIAPTIEVASSPFPQPVVVGAYGDYRVYLPAPGTVTLSFFDSARVERLPTTTVAVPTMTSTRDWWYVPAPNAVTNGHFEESGGWTGSWSSVTPAVSGATAARLAAGQSISQSVTLEAGSHVSLVWHPLAAGAQLRVTLASQQWVLDGTGSNWRPWHSLVGGMGTRTLTLEAVGGAVAVDQVGLGQPDEVPFFTYLPLSTR